MKFTFLNTVLISSVLILSNVAHSTIITHGYLTTDDTTDIITNTVTGFEYLRFDAYDLTYTQTFEAIATGGVYEGWSIADSSISDAFISGVLGGTSLCDGAVEYRTYCGTVPGWTWSDFTDSSAAGLAFYLYISVYDTPDRTETDVGGAYIDGAGNVYDLDDLVDYEENFVGINLLLYRDPSNTVEAVAEPSTLAIFALGLIGVASRRFKKLS